MLIQTLKPMGFAHQRVWVMGYHGLMGYGLQIPAHQFGGPKKLWDFRGYGLSGAWVTRVSTVGRPLAAEKNNSTLGVSFKSLGRPLVWNFELPKVSAIEF